MKNKLFLAALGVVLLSWPKTAAAQCSTFSGRATVVQSTALGIGPVVLSDTGNLDSSGGAKQASLVNASVLGLAAVEVLHASAIGEGTSSQSEASLANLTLTVAGNTITADFLMARANANCGSGGTTVSGSADIAGLAANGQTIIVSGSPNQTISLPGGVTIIINEQVSSLQGGNGSITVNALHVSATGIADVVISSASAGVGPFVVIIGGGGGGPGCPFVTGGGWVPTTSDAKANFGVGGSGTSQTWGHLEYVDHGNSNNVHGTSFTASVTPNGTGGGTLTMTGSAEVNGVPGFTYSLQATDNAEPGRGSDTFGIQVYDANNIQVENVPFTTLLGGGNIQYHSCH